MNSQRPQRLMLLPALQWDSQPIPLSPSGSSAVSVNGRLHLPMGLVAPGPNGVRDGNMGAGGHHVLSMSQGRLSRVQPCLDPSTFLVALPCQKDSGSQIEVPEPKVGHDPILIGSPGPALHLLGPQAKSEALAAPPSRVAGLGL